MTDSIDYVAMTRMLIAASRRLAAAEKELSELDAATGDGDHGAAMCKVAEAICATIAQRSERSLSGLLSDIGIAVMATDTGSTGPLYGSWFMGMGSSADGVERLDADGLVRLLDEGIRNLRTVTKAEPGDKTMLDALIPAADAMRAATEAGKPLSSLLEAAAAAAAAGADATRDLTAALGRARNIGERSVGHKDPGAVSMAILLAGLKEGYADA